MIDVEPLIISGLDQLVPLPSGESANWQEVLASAGVAPRPYPSRKRLVAVLVALAAAGAIVVATPVGAALGHGLDSFSTWLTGSPGSSSSQDEQRAFDRATRSWAGFPRGTKLRRLVSTQTGGATFALYGFRGSGALCLRLTVTGSASTHTLACPPLSALRGSKQPALVVVANDGVGATHQATNAPFVFATPKFNVTFGVVADGVKRVELGHSNGTTTTALLSGDTFLDVQSPSPVTRAWATVGGRRVALPLTAAASLLGFPQTTGPQLTVHGPATVQRTIHGGAIHWLAHRQPRGTAVPTTIHHIVGVLPDVIFHRELTPDPSAPERIVVSVRPAGSAYSGLHLRNKLQVCAEVVGGRFPGGGCWPAGRLFSMAPFSLGAWRLPGDQITTIAGLASDDVAKLTLFLGTGRRVAVPLHDNGYITSAAKADYPLRLVAYDSQQRVIGIRTLQTTGLSGFTPPTVPQPIGNAHWRRLFKTDTGAVFVAPSTTGGTCYAIRIGETTTGPNCQTSPTATELQLGVGWIKNSAEIVGRVGSDISRVLVHLQNGKTRTLTPIQGYILTALPPSASASHSPVLSITAVQANGQVIEQPGSSLSGGSGTITRLTAASITIGTPPATHTCRVTTHSPSLSGYTVGLHVQYLCTHNALSLIGRSTPRKSATWATRTVRAEGPITTLTPNRITLRNTLARAGTPAATMSCALTKTSPPTDRYRVAERVQAFCSHGRLTGLNRAYP